MPRFRIVTVFTHIGPIPLSLFSVDGLGYGLLELVHVFGLRGSILVGNLGLAVKSMGYESCYERYG